MPPAARVVSAAGHPGSPPYPQAPVDRQWKTVWSSWAFGVDNLPVPVDERMRRSDVRACAGVHGLWTRSGASVDKPVRTWNSTGVMGTGVDDRRPGPHVVHPHDPGADLQERMLLHTVHSPYYDDGRLNLGSFFFIGCGLPSPHLPRCTTQAGERPARRPSPRRHRRRHHAPSPGLRRGPVREPRRNREAAS